MIMPITMSSGVIAGIVIAVFAVIIIIVAVVIFKCKPAPNDGRKYSKEDTREDWNAMDVMNDPNMNVR